MAPVRRAGPAVRGRLAGLWIAMLLALAPAAAPAAERYDPSAIADFRALAGGLASDGRPFATLRKLTDIRYDVEGLVTYDGETPFARAAEAAFRDIAEHCRACRITGVTAAPNFLVLRDLFLDISLRTWTQRVPFLQEDRDDILWRKTLGQPVLMSWDDLDAGKPAPWQRALVARSTVAIGGRPFRIVAFHQAALPDTTAASLTPATAELGPGQAWTYLALVQQSARGLPLAGDLFAELPEPMQRKVLYAAILRGMGFVADTPPAWSVMSFDNAMAEPGPRDWAALDLLADPRIRPTMSLDEAVAAIGDAPGPAAHPRPGPAPPPAPPPARDAGLAAALIMAVGVLIQLLPLALLLARQVYDFLACVLVGLVAGWTGALVQLLGLVLLTHARPDFQSLVWAGPCLVVVYALCMELYRFEMVRILVNRAFAAIAPPGGPSLYPTWLATVAVTLAVILATFGFVWPGNGIEAWALRSFWAERPAPWETVAGVFHPPESRLHLGRVLAYFDSLEACRAWGRRQAAAAGDADGAAGSHAQCLIGPTDPLSPGGSRRLADGS
ncbi:hypothetical protein [Labrys wisconsinensis]|uniref:CHASE2 domain-containing protein n=1 Tax=Labrys wisconsinensis TaxID=425677 RepID=A0ABU0JIY3_9HYPH|nr:hypothetical protein [Labrys wisconsinensis]MDQ0474214.1 hypothetical protein [Labrys wisconsinensis]